MHYKVVEIKPGVTLLRDRDANIYVVEGKTSALVVDSGYGFLDLKSQIEEITRKPIIAVCTHGHIDHAFGGHHFDVIYMSREELPIYEKHTIFKKYIVENHAPDVKVLSKEALEEWYRAKPKRIEFIEPGDLLDIGDNILEIVSLKGHTPGSIGILDRKHRILFSGDGLCNYIWMQLPESSYLSEYYEILNSLSAYEEDFDFICNGHSQVPLPAAFIEQMKETINDLFEGAQGKPYNNPNASGWHYVKNGCEIMYQTDKIKKT